MNPTKKQLNKHEQNRQKSIKLFNEAYKALRKAELSIKNNQVASYLTMEAESKVCFIIKEILK